MSTIYDAIIIGGGHNGLVTAAYLARAGRSVLVLERREIVGGCAVTEELWPGFKVSTASATAMRHPRSNSITPASSQKRSRAWASAVWKHLQRRCTASRWPRSVAWTQAVLLIRSRA